MKATADSAAPDGFVPSPDSSFVSAHELLGEFLKNPEASALPAQSGKFEGGAQVALLLAALERIEFNKQQGKKAAVLSGLVKKLAGRKLVWTEEQLACCLNCSARILGPKDPQNINSEELDSPIPGVVPALLEQVESGFKQGAPQTVMEAIGRLHAALKPMEFWAGYKKTVQRMEALLAQKTAGLPDDGEPWAEAIRQDIERMTPKKREQWLALLQNAPKGTTAKPTAKWKKQADELLGAVGHEQFSRQLEQWFGLVGRAATQRIQTRNAAMLRALVWYASLLSGETVCRALANAVEGGLRKLPGGFLYASSISKACITALESMPGLEPIAQLSRLRRRVKSPWGLEEIEKAFASAVERSGVSRTEIEEICLPTFGLDQDGTLRQQFGEHSARLSIVGTREVALQWFDAAGKELADKPKLSKAQAAEEKALKQLARDMEKMLGAQKDRVENFLERDRVWPFAVWKSRYFEHPLMANLSRRLIWLFREGKQSASGIWHEQRFVQADGDTLDWPGQKTEVRLWHPLGVEPASVQAWRQWLEEHQVTQPFKQAHREIYLLTEAEQATRTYSNRFAAHILRQHQFKALCEQRGWKSEFVGSWDPGGATPTRDLPGWALRAEYWVEVAGEEFAPSGVSLHVSSDQVRFLNADGQSVELSEVPALVFSEIMRDVDLFVGVCSIGNDPTWYERGDQEGGYWHNFSFGDLSATAKTRREVLERLLPRLKIASQCSLSEKFLVVRGTLGTYKIHLGSSNVLMEPNDHYLCIVPDRGAATSNHQQVFLPFEGDATLAVILSKAFLLADDTTIKDSSIIGQIQQR